jgi:sigma-E factor negative regulatory protein RseC
MEVEVWNRLGAVIGDRVQIRISGRSTLMAAFLLYLVPLLAFLAGVVIGERLTGDQVWAVISGLAFLAVVYGLIRLLDRRLGKAAGMRPEIISILAGKSSPSESEGDGGTADRTAGEA